MVMPAHPGDDGLSGEVSAGQREVPVAGPSAEQGSGLADGGTAPGATLDG